MGVRRRKDRDGRWEYEFELHGQRYRRLCRNPDGSYSRTRAEAMAAEAEARKAARDNAKTMSSAPAGHFTLAQALNLHIRKVSLDASASHVASLKRIAGEQLAHFGVDRAVVEIHQGDIVTYVEFLKQQKRRVWIGGPRRIREGDHDNPRLWKDTDRPRSVSEINHCLDVLRGALQLAHRTRHPGTGESLLPFPPDIPSLEEPRRVPTPMSEAEYRARLAHGPQWTREAAALSWWFGLRLAECLRLELRHIDHEHRCLRLLGEETKSGRDEAVHGGDRGWVLVRWLERQARRRGITFLVAWPGTKWARRSERPPLDVWRPLTTFKRSWARSAKLAGIEQPHRFHDVRAAYITSIARHGSAALTRQLARHASTATTERYIGLVEKEAAAVADLAAKRRSRPKTGSR